MISICSLQDCDRLHFGKGLCQRHLERKRRLERQMGSAAQCNIDSCELPAVSRGWCEGHYRRWVDHGDPTGGRRSPNPGPCSLEACERPAKAKGWCTLHYYRWKRTGSLSGPGAVEKLCSIEGCGQPHSGKGWCRLHYERWRSSGDPLVVRPSSRDLSGPASPNWSGDVATYNGTHLRLRRIRGLARQHPCVDCGGQSAHWSYDHADPDEVFDKGLRYSAKIEHYEPRCTTCHARFDRKPKVRS